MATGQQPTVSAGQQPTVSAGQPTGADERAPGGQAPSELPPAEADRASSRRLASHPAVGFIPWVLFWVIGGQSTWETGAIAALIAAVFVMALSLAPGPLAAPLAAVPGPPRAAFRVDPRHLKLLDVATVVFFVTLTVAAVLSSRPDVAQLDRYSQAISSGTLGLIALGSIVFGHPFTVDYAGEEAPQVWHTALFKRINLILTTAWTAVFLLCAALGLAAEQAGAKGMRDWLNWYIPIALIFLVLRFTSWYPSRARSRPGKGHR